MFTNVVRMGRSLTGATSEAYWVVRVWNMPHGMPQNTSPITNVCTLGAKNRMKMKHIIDMRAPIIVLR
jgi:hypothetical protein